MKTFKTRYHCPPKIIPKIEIKIKLWHYVCSAVHSCLSVWTVVVVRVCVASVLMNAQYNMSFGNGFAFHGYHMPM